MFYLRLNSFENNRANFDNQMKMFAEIIQLQQ